MWTKKTSMWTKIGVLAAVIGAVGGILSIEIKDEAICGSEEVKQEVTPKHKYQSCRNKLHGVEKHNLSRVVTKTSSWRGGGGSQPGWCEEVMSNFERNINQTVKWGKPKSSERHRRDASTGFVSKYKYTCSVEAEWDPVYKKKRSSECDLSPPETKIVNVALTCPLINVFK